MNFLNIPRTTYQLVVSMDKIYGIIRSLDDPTKPYDHRQHESQYTQLSEYVMTFVQQQMQQQYSMQEVWIPEPHQIEPEYSSLPKCNIFMSYAFRQPIPEINRKQRALVLIQGSGAVRAGIWARSVCINDGLETGSMLPFIDLAKRLNLAVMVMNPNYTSDPETGIPIPNSNSMVDHALFVWENYVLNSGFEDICVVAHSAGGECL